MLNNHKNDEQLSEEKRLEIVKFLLENECSDSNDLLQICAKDGNLKIVKWLLKNGADIHVYNDSPLILSAQNGHLDVVKYLVENGANIHADDNEALKSALFFGFTEVADYLKNAPEKLLQYKMNRYFNSQI